MQKDDDDNNAKYDKLIKEKDRILDSIDKTDDI